MPHATFALSFTDNVTGAPLLTHVKAINFLFQRGTLPSQGTILCKQQTIVKTIGTVTISYTPASGSLVSIVLPGSLVVSGSKVLGSDGTMQLTFLDRRWRWGFGHIDGRYNVRKEDGTLIREKTPAQLMSLCLDAMGEAGYDVSAVTVGARPFVEWRGDVPAECLQELCDDLGYVPVIRGDNTVKIYAVNDGSLLPTQYASSINFAVEQGALPNKVRIACGDVLYQCKFKLEAVGEEPDGRVVPIDELSYKPAAGWITDEAPSWPSITGTTTVDGKPVSLRDFARRSVYRMYRIKAQAHTSENLAPPGFIPGPGAFAAEHVTEIEQLLPLVGRLNAERELPDGTKEPLKPRVSGVFDSEDDNDAFTPPDTLYPGSYSIDLKRGIVIFGSPVYLIQDSAVAPADMRLTCCVSVTTLEGAKQYYGYDAIADAAGAGIKTVDHSEITPKVSAFYKNSPATGFGDDVDFTSDNLAYVDEQAGYYAAAEIERLTPQQGGSVSYGRIVALELDGLRSQISWNAQEGQVPYTEAALATQINSYLPSYSELQRQARAEHQLKRLAQLEKLIKSGKWQGQELPAASELMMIA